MALTVETGTGLAGADAYLTVADFKTYCSNRGMRWEDAEDHVIEASIRRATEWIDSEYRYKGARLVSTQALEFPRSGLYDWSGHAVTGVPKRIKDATAELAFKGLSEDINADLERGGMISSETIGPISVSYSESAPAGKVYSLVDKSLQQYVRDTSKETAVGALWTEPATEMQFSIGMNDHVPADQESTG